MKLGRGGAAGIALLGVVLAGCTTTVAGSGGIDPAMGAPRVSMAGETRIETVPMFRPDGGPGTVLAGAEVTPLTERRGFVCGPEELFGGLYECGMPQTDWLMSFCGVLEKTMYCPGLHYDSDQLIPVFQTSPVEGERPSRVSALPGPVPWAVELSDGSLCVYGQGLGSARPDAYTRYFCYGDTQYLWQVDGGPVFTETPSGWTAQAGRDARRPALQTVTVRRAVIFTES